MIKVKPHSCVQQLVVSDLVGTSYDRRAQLSCDMRPHKQLDLIQLAIPHTHVVFLLYLLHVILLYSFETRLFPYKFKLSLCESTVQYLWTSLYHMLVQHAQLLFLLQLSPVLIIFSVNWKTTFNSVWNSCLYQIDMRPHKQWDLTQLADSHTSVVVI